jgi:hypothetical protein
MQQDIKRTCAFDLCVIQRLLCPPYLRGRNLTYIHSPTSHVLCSPELYFAVPYCTWYARHNCCIHWIKWALNGEVAFVLPSVHLRNCSAKLIEGFEVPTDVVMKNSIFWDIAPCNPLEVNGRFGGTCRLYLQGLRISQAWKRMALSYVPLKRRLTLDRRRYVPEELTSQLKWNLEWKIHTESWCSLILWHLLYRKLKSKYADSQKLRDSMWTPFR